MVLGGRVGKVVEDYDVSKCRLYYSDSSFVSASPHTETVSSMEHI